MLYPSFYAGGIYNDNPYATRSDRIGLAGVQINPALEIYRDNGLYKTDASFGALITVYPGAGPIYRYSDLLLTKIHDAPPTNFTGHATVTQTWKPLPDLCRRQRQCLPLERTLRDDWKWRHTRRGGRVNERRIPSIHFKRANDM